MIEDASLSVSDEDVSVSTTSVNSQTRYSGSAHVSLAAENKTKAVKLSKVLVLLVLLLSAGACGAATFFYTTAGETNDFKSQFNDFATEIVDMSQQKAESVTSSMKGISTIITSLAEELNLTWPFITIPHFGFRLMQVNKLTNALLTGFSPLVPVDDRMKWETYSVENQGWTAERFDYNTSSRKTIFIQGSFPETRVSDALYRVEDDGTVIYEKDVGPYLPAWQLSPAPSNTSIVNYNLLSNPALSGLYHGMLRTGRMVLSEALLHSFLYNRSISENVPRPHSIALQPVYGTLDAEQSRKDIKGVFLALLPWDTFFNKILTKDICGILVVLTDTCGDAAFTYRLNQMQAIYAGEGDLHEQKYNDYVLTSPFENLVTKSDESCNFLLSVYPSSELEMRYRTKKPILYTTVVILVFFFTSMVFVFYDVFVQRRQDEVMETAQRSNELVASIFPSNVRDRIMQDATDQVDAEMNVNSRKGAFRTTKKWKGLLIREGTKDEANLSVPGSKPIADLFPAATIMFADISGFTAWSSVREPSQVFQLLESLFHAFDEIAQTRRVFKVETVGDCYLAVAGLPEPRKDHAVVMARFAGNCLSKMNDLSKKLEVSLGPDTGELSLRVGLHSGPVTAGVLRGDKARFQLFGDTVNTASRMESNGARNKIHCSHETAQLLREAGKSHWVIRREDKIVAKGKGELQTYWLDISMQSATSTKSGSTVTSNSESEGKKPTLPPNVLEEQIVNDFDDGENKIPTKTNISDKVERLVHWNADILHRLLQKIVARRNATQKGNSEQGALFNKSPIELHQPKDHTVLDEVKEIITLPRYNARVNKNQEDFNTIQLSQSVVAQLYDYVTVIATMYNDNPFHNFEHASHVTMSVVKLLSRIVAPDEILQDSEDDKHVGKFLHDHTYGITSDPLTQFAVVFSALIHDVDHSGVPNAQLVKENTKIAATYKNKSVAEQNSVDMAWDLLMDDTFSDLRAVIYSTNAELKRFRQLVVNTVMATDIVDKELKDLRNARWDKAFEKGMTPDSKDSREDVNRKATIVIEHLIQASDIAHTMQHWHIYRKWNERFFEEMQNAYEAGRAEQNPAEFWYQGEIGFFDFYIIPLAKKLKDCGVFGVSSDEYLNYALANRKEWELKGEAVVAKMVENYRKVKEQ